MDRKDRVVLRNGDHKNFTPRPADVPQELKGLSAQVVAELLDAARCFGAHDDDDHVRRLTRKKVTLSVSEDPQNHTLIVLGPGGQTSGAGSYIVGLSGEGDHLLFWDKRVSLEDALQVIEEADNVAYERGIIDADGSRAECDLHAAEGCLPKLLADRVCARPGYKTVRFSQQEAEQVLSEFRDPEKMRIIPTLFSLFLICHQKDEDYIRRQAGVIRNVAARHGIPADCMDHQRFPAIAAEVDEAIAGL